VELTNLRTPNEIELDIFVPGKNVALEYQGERHYFDIETYGQQEKSLGIDSEKALGCGLRAVTLIEVPYWWKAGKATLLSTLSQFTMAGGEVMKEC